VYWFQRFLQTLLFTAFVFSLMLLVGINSQFFQQQWLYMVSIGF